jgi:HEAT repeat protein
LTQAPAAQQEKVLEKLRDSKGAVHTQALASAIPKLAEPARKKAREALAERMTRMTASTLRDKLQDENVEIRRAAALACAMKDDKTHIPDLITALEDAEPIVIRAARAGLKSLTGQDFGPTADASRAERLKAVADWKTWWNNQPRK